MDKETTQFCEDLLQSVREMKADRRARVTEVATSPALKARVKTGLSQSQFAMLLGVSIRTLQEWEQGRRNPSGAAKTLIAIAEKWPEVLWELAN
ncbi:MAG: helix-turn-helix domain-containing protein [Candidatus Competibacteraceae bacterium]